MTFDCFDYKNLDFNYVEAMQMHKRLEVLRKKSGGKNTTFGKENENETYIEQIKCFNCANEFEVKIPKGISIREYNPACPRCGCKP